MNLVKLQDEFFYSFKKNSSCNFTCATQVANTSCPQHIIFGISASDYPRIAVETTFLR